MLGFCNHSALFSYFEVDMAIANTNTLGFPIFWSDKPDPEDLQYFLEFQVPRQWAPMFNELALGPQRRKASYPSLQFRFFGPKLQVNTAQVIFCFH